MTMNNNSPIPIFTPFLLTPLREFDMNTVHYFSSSTPTPTLLLELSYNYNNNNNLIQYYNIVLDYQCERDRLETTPLETMVDGGIR
jgi:hypothetical protein